jgi:hypothetical protein
MPLTVKQVGRTRQYCSDRCRKEVTRHPHFRDSSGGPYPAEGLSGNLEKTSTKTRAKIAILADRESAFKPVWRVAVGPADHSPI